MRRLLHGTNLDGSEYICTGKIVCIVLRDTVQVGFSHKLAQYINSGAIFTTNPPRIEKTSVTVSSHPLMPHMTVVLPCLFRITVGPPVLFHRCQSPRPDDYFRLSKRAGYTNWDR